MNSAIRTDIEAWCSQPADLWDYETTCLLAQHEWENLRKRYSWNAGNYSTAGYILNSPELSISKTPISTWLNENKIYLEAPYPNKLGLFYARNGLSYVKEDDLYSTGAVEKLDDALKLLDSVPGLINSITQLVRVIGVLKSTSRKEDVSYSHPEIPFSIFVSVCDERDFIASARVAESILHEAMHLRLSLIQKMVDLLGSQLQGEEQYFSPWRREKRPVNGVLHGIFVFRAILEFFRKLASNHRDNRVTEYSIRRIKEISAELMQVKDFYKTAVLSATGKKLARHLVHI